MTSKKALHKSYADFLSQYHWQWFCTFTFREPPHPEKAFKTFRYWVKRINREIYGCRAQKRNQSVYWALALEYHKSGIIHFHALVGDVGDLNILCSRKLAHSIWFKIAGINRIDPIDDNLAMVTNYVSKYVVKGGEIDLSENLEKYPQQLSGLAT